jgi:hypothetical protein
MAAGGCLPYSWHASFLALGEAAAGAGASAAFGGGDISPAAAQAALMQ